MTTLSLTVRRVAAAWPYAAGVIAASAIDAGVTVWLYDAWPLFWLVLGVTLVLNGVAAAVIASVLRGGRR